MESAEVTSTTTLADKAYEALRNEVLSGRLGSAYPILEQEIAGRLNMSRTPVRSAIQRLIHEDLIERVGRKGIFVKPLTVTDVEQAYEAAEGLEGMLVLLATKYASDTKLKELEAVVREMVNAGSEGNLKRWTECDRQFHQLIGQLAENPIILGFINQVQIVIERVRYLSISVKPGMPIISAREHFATVEAMISRDGALARRLHQSHWQRVREEVVSILRASLSGEIVLK